MNELRDYLRELSEITTVGVQETSGYGALEQLLNAAGRFPPSPAASPRCCCSNHASTRITPPQFPLYHNVGAHGNVPLS